MTGSNKETYVGWRVMLESCQKMRELLFKTQIISSMFIVASNYILPRLKKTKKQIDELNKMFYPKYIRCIHVVKYQYDSKTIKC